MLLVVMLLIFGAKRLPETGRALGHGMREFKEAIIGTERTTIHPPPQPQTVEHPALAAKRRHTQPGVTGDPPGTFGEGSGHGLG